MVAAAWAPAAAAAVARAAMASSSVCGSNGLGIDPCTMSSIEMVRTCLCVRARARMCVRACGQNLCVCVGGREGATGGAFGSLQYFAFQCLQRTAGYIYNARARRLER